MKLNELVHEKVNSARGRIDTRNMDKLKTADLLGGQKLTVEDYEMVSNPKTGDKFPVILFAEFPNAYYLGGQVFTDILSAIDGDQEAKDEFEQTGLAVSLSLEKSSNNREYVAVTPYEDITEKSGKKSKAKK